MRILFFISTFSIFSTSQSATLIEDVGSFLQKVSEKLTENLSDNDPYSNSTIDDFVNENGYPLETYEVTTEDGYILTLHRIPYGRNDNPVSNSNSTSKPVIVFKSGIGSSAWDFLYLGKNESLGMIFADLGYDIWLINTRGNRYSMKHTLYSSAFNSEEFWDYSFHEKGHYDLPASIDFIINTTNTNNVTLITHSQGTIESLVCLITRPEYQNKINLLVLFSPVPYLSNTENPFIKAAYTFREEIHVFVDLFQIRGLPFNSMVSLIARKLCSNESPVQDICFVLLESVFGVDYEQFNKSLLSFYIGNFPDGTSLKEFFHYEQEIQAGEFRQYDYGAKNLAYYNDVIPPDYNISCINTPIAAYYGKNDLIASVKDVEKFLIQVPNLVASKLIDFELFNHIDFIWAKDVSKFLYDHVIKEVRTYNPIS